MLLCIDSEIYTFYNILKLIFNEIVKYKEHLNVKLLIKIDNMDQNENKLKCEE